jgi:pyruvate carboxylase
MLMGNLGQPMGGWPKKLQQVVLGKQKPLTGRPGASLKPLNLKKVREEISTKLKREANDDDLYSHLMYPEVFAEFTKFVRDYSDVGVLPTPAFFYGLKPNEEISIDIEEGKTLFVRLINIGQIDKDGRRIVTFELNGMPRETTIQDRSVAPKTKARAKADPADPMQIGAPIPGLITAISASVGAKVAKGDKLLTMEAMKMQTTIYASADGTVDKIFAQVGETVESKDLLVKLKS